ncbi:hypothetical protein PQC07_gp056 [Aeromonas phage D3]|uniref:Uncharacterized protein n=1 Tax=Aeromonas phage D3 TaxID=2593327 RepID=A0A514TV99_9CAUD|nr:hypothetical protein PQC07_gp056 [Aeromonas phage D3]QDJ96949.1 hypothetical protein D3_0219 [Aeromonas phage D3]
MNIAFGMPDHTDALLAGFEELNTTGKLEGPDGEYLHTCLRLNGLEDIAGNEGLGTAIVGAGKKFYEMVMNFLKMVKDFFFGSKGRGQDQAVTKAVADTNKVSKTVEAEIKTASEEVKAKAETKAKELNVLLAKPLPATLKGLSDKYVTNKNGMINDVCKSAETIGEKCPTFEAEFKAIQAAYDKVDSMIERRKDGNFSGVVKTTAEAYNLASLVQGLRGAYRALQSKSVAENTKFAEIYNKMLATGTEMEQRHANKVTNFLTKMNNELGRAIDSCNKLIFRLCEAGGDVAKAFRPIDMIEPADLEAFMGFDPSEK